MEQPGSGTSPPTSSGDVAPNSASAGSSLWTRSFCCLNLAEFLQSLGYASMVLLPLYLGHLDASRAEIGLLMSLANFAGLATRPAVGWALDVWGRKPTLVIGTTLMVGSMACLGFALTLGPLIYASRIAFGIGQGILFAGYAALAADVITPQRRTEGLAIFGIFSLLPLALNPVASRWVDDPGHLRFYFPAVSLLVAASLLALMFIRGPVAAQGAEKLRLREVAAALASPALRPVWLATALLSAMVMAFATFATVAAEARGLTHPANLWFTYAVGSIVVRIVGGRLPDRIGPGKLVLPCAVIYATACLLLGWAGSPFGFLAAGALAGIGHGFLFPILTSQLVTRTPTNLRGSAIAAFTALFEISFITLAPSLGSVADRFGDRVMFTTVAIIGVLGALVWARLESRYGARDGAVED